MAADNPTPTDTRPQARLIAKWRAEADAEVARLKRYCYDGDLDGAMPDDDIEHGFAQNAQLRRCADELAALDRQEQTSIPLRPDPACPTHGDPLVCVACEAEEDLKPVWPRPHRVTPSRLRGEPRRPDVERLSQQAGFISEILHHAGIGPCPLTEGVQHLVQQRDELLTALDQPPAPSVDVDELVATVAILCNRGQDQAAKEAVHAFAIDQRCKGHGDGQMHAIADVNAGRVDDMIAPRLAALDQTALYDELAAAVLTYATPGPPWSHQALVALAATHAEDSHTMDQRVDQTAPQEPCEHTFNLIAWKHHEKVGHHCSKCGVLRPIPAPPVVQEQSCVTCGHSRTEHNYPGLGACYAPSKRHGLCPCERFVAPPVVPPSGDNR